VRVCASAARTHFVGFDEEEVAEGDAEVGHARRHGLGLESAVVAAVVCGRHQLVQLLQHSPGLRVDCFACVRDTDRGQRKSQRLDGEASQRRTVLPGLGKARDRNIAESSQDLQQSVEVVQLPAFLYGTSDEDK
jgi:hypothetical protein